MTGDRNERPVKPENPDRRERPRQPARPSRPKIFLYLAALMLLLAVAAYAFQGSLQGLAGDWTTFLFALVLPVLMALFFLYCYRVPRYGLKLLGRSVELGDPGEKAAGLSYNVFKGESAADEKLAQTRRKSARHLRRRLARATPRPGEATPRPVPEPRETTARSPDDPLEDEDSP